METANRMISFMAELIEQSIDDTNGLVVYVESKKESLHENNPITRTNRLMKKDQSTSRRQAIL